MINKSFSQLSELLAGNTSLDAIKQCVQEITISVPNGECVHKHQFGTDFSGAVSFSVGTDRSDPGLFSALRKIHLYLDPLEDVCVLINQALGASSTVKVEPIFEFDYKESYHESAVHKLGIRFTVKGEDLYDKSGKFVRKDPDIKDTLYLV